MDMDENFKDKLKAYTNGDLYESQRIELEKELDKLEIYQSYLDDFMKPDPNAEQMSKNFKEKKLIKKGIWKSRIQNAFTALCILFLICIGCWIVTTFFYTWGEPDRANKYEEIIRTSLEATQPNTTIGNGGTQSGILKLYINDELRKQIGNGYKSIGELKASLFFGLPNVDISNEMNSNTFFIYPEQQKRFQPEDGFKRLEKLPEGTVSELYVSFSNYVSTEEALKLFEGKNMLPVWFAVDTGFDRKNIDMIDQPLGFPYNGFNLLKNEKVISKEKTGNWISGTETEGSENLSFALYGDASKRNKEFQDVLVLMNSNPLLSQSVIHMSKNTMKEKTNYIEKNGVRIYGVVVTGPSKELLKLQKEKWVGKSILGDVDFWNWNETN